ncbi:MAG: transglycosylase SLT domain-containing protein [Treponemataceae bacterium]|nr:transglycosylase SLT domain-containing protein [Treponemataceae bacterium]
MQKKSLGVLIAFLCFCVPCTAETPATVIQDESLTIDAVNIPEYIPLDIEYPNHRLVLKFHNDYTQPYNMIKLQEIMLRAGPYRPYIRQKLMERNMPLCLEYLPVIESSFNYRAVSKSGATGLWQFMENSIGKSLIKNTWVDQRKDPWLSTDAALTKLQENYDYFQDWALALAAYNMGLGGLKRVMNSTGCKTYWELIDGGHLRTETMLYVPKFLAVADLITNAEYYEMNLPAYDESLSPQYETITVSQQVDLVQLGEKAGISLAQLRDLNPALSYNVTPYGMNWDLRVPQEKADMVRTALETMDVCLTDLYTVKKGDTLWGISRKYGITVQDLCDANNIRENAILRIGTTLFVPITK